MKDIMSYFKNEDPKTETFPHILVSAPKKPRRTTTLTMDETNKFLKNFYIPRKNDIEIRPNKQTENNNPKRSAVDESKKIVVYTDGSCINNGKENALGGYAVYFPGSELENFADKFIDKPTNQRCELSAIAKAFHLCMEHIKNEGYIIVYTDSEYCMKCLREYCKKWSINGWKKSNGSPIENRDIIEPLYAFYSENWRQIDIRHVRAHTKNTDEHSLANAEVDKMARNAALSAND